MLKEALAYFGDDSGYHRLFSLFKKKYESLGRIGGTVKVADFKDKELSAVARFFGVSSDELRDKGKVSLEQFEQQLQRTRFEGIGLKELLEAYFKKPFISNKEAKEQKNKKLFMLLDRLKEDHPFLSFWFAHLQQKTADTYWIYRLIDDDEQMFIHAVKQLHAGICGLKDNYERLPIYSQRIAGNPHAFDRNTTLGKLLIHVLAVDRNRTLGVQVTVPTDSEAINDLLLEFKLLRDDITNFVTCVNIIGETSNGIHPMWAAASKSSSVLNMPLRELIPLERAYPARGKCVWIVENSGVYSSILDQVPNAPLICTHGQFKLAALWLMDRLVKSGCMLHYAGDFDPEGLGMATRLLGRYPEHVKLWRMDITSYRKAVTDVFINEERLNKLSSIDTSELVAVREEMKKSGRAGYQESLVTDMVTDLLVECAN
ncbi:TIGR02679 family protein [Aquibacillus sp. 3ASR75-11]|uniref:TIGR02679 family protein n=1 Tax=Terrihalobacillus insolitus TaxID=2950438 RepID=A0A9X3WRT6_9BACI|nr:TIGR02679 family protein [Terrihalobacillus insolitus]MDC3414687.1 TIGR02679 family protein [Terrihalobacillus insolitus]MDC3424200.1 TIGR02679 family protein [Terrihalobacillus insolitus]